MRIQHDKYYTANQVLNSFCSIWLPEKGSTILEPCAGGQAFSDLYSYLGYDVVTNELYPDRNLYYDFCRDATSEEVWSVFWDDFDYVITNPPFELSTRILSLSWKYSQKGVCFLLPTNWFNEPCKDRRDLLSELYPHLRIKAGCNPRPKFIEGKNSTDNKTVEFLVFEKSYYNADHPFRQILDWR